jgi:hypothetical protein
MLDAIKMKREPSLGAILRWQSILPGTLAFNYQKPYVRTIFDLGNGFSYRMTWNYYGYNGKGGGIERDTRTGGDSHTGFQWQHGRIRAPLRFLKRDGEIELKMWRSGQ